MKKIYSTRYNNLSLTLTKGGISVEVQFKHGCIGANTRAKLITSDKLIQYFLESDPRFNSLYRLDRSIPEPSDEEEKKAKEIKPKEDKHKSNAEVVESVTDLTSAIDYFAANEIICIDLKQVKAAMKKTNVEFPNWK